MPISPARVAAFEILLRVDQQNAFTAELLHSSARQTLSGPDHRLAMELVMGVLRWRSVLDLEIASRSSIKLARIDPEVLTALRLAAYQLMFLDRIPARAAIHESVELVKRARKRSAAPFANALLRELARSPTRPALQALVAKGESGSELARLFAHPQWLVERWIHEFGIDVAREICLYDQRIPETAITIYEASLVRELETRGIKLAPGRLLGSSRRVVTGDLAELPPPLQAQITIQDEASQLVALLTGTGSRILDCCAAPGGKTRVLAESNPSALIIAGELHPHRARRLRKQVTAGNVRVIAADARAIPVSVAFDSILVDVPCSGTGTLARNPEIKWRLKPEDLVDLQARQAAILRSVMRQLVSGGTVVYSTCSLEKEENEEVVEQTLSLETSFRLVDCRERLQQLQTDGKLVWKDIASLARGPYLRTTPGVHPCDGLFAAVLKKM
ncbi:MAG TPA: transcription antitermination factor NusB [Terriglobales bacterium]|nr:transcription antitermination factor NusB [Terriglobales bacterium]